MSILQSITAAHSENGTNAASKVALRYFIDDGFPNADSTDFACCTLCEDADGNSALNYVSQIHTYIMRNVYPRWAENDDERTSDEVFRFYDWLDELISSQSAKTLSIMVVLLGKDIYRLCCKGNIRAYFVHNDDIEQLNMDELRIAEMLANPPELPINLNRYLINPRVRSGSIPSYDLIMRRRKSGGKLVMCTKGLWQHISDAEIQQLVFSNSESKAAANLIDLAKERGSHEDLAVVIA